MKKKPHLDKAYCIATALEKFNIGTVPVIFEALYQVRSPLLLEHPVIGLGILLTSIGAFVDGITRAAKGEYLKPSAGIIGTARQYLAKVQK